MDEILSHYQNHPAIIPCTVPAGAKIVRSSTNDTKEFHRIISPLSYQPIVFARTDRASLKGKPMFYETIFTSAAVKNNAIPRIFQRLRNYSYFARLQSYWTSLYHTEFMDSRQRLAFVRLSILQQLQASLRRCFI